MVAAVQLKEYVSDAGNFCIIVSKFSYQKELYPVVLLEIDKSTEISFHCTVLPFSLTVSFKVEGSGKFLLDT